MDGRSFATAGCWTGPVLLLLLGIPIFFHGLGSYSVVSSDEAFYQCVAENMWSAREWFTIRCADREFTFLMNSPLPFWVRALAIGVLGDNAWSMRILSASFGLVSVLATYGLARRRLPRPESFLAALLLMTAFQFVYLHGARTGELDTIVVCVFVWIAREFLVAVEESRSFVRHHVALLVLLSLKLPLLVFPVLAELAYFASVPADRRHFRRWWPPLAILPLGLLWPLAQAMRDPQGAVHGLAWMVRQATQSSRSPGHYGGIVLFGFFPQILLVPWAYLAPRRPDPDEACRFLRMMKITPVVVLVVFTLIGRKFPWYVLPAYPFLAILAGDWVGREIRSPGRLTVPALVLSLAAALTIGFEPEMSKPLANRWFRFPTPRFEPGEPWPGPLLALAVALLVPVVVSRGRRLAARRIVSLVCVGSIAAGALVRTVRPLSNLSHESRLERVALDLDRRLERGEEIDFPVTLPYATEPIVLYYFGRRFRVEPGMSTGEGASPRKVFRIVGPREDRPPGATGSGP